jgi:hypothetical protein
LRKEMLIAESELNRARLIDEWQTMTAGMRGVVNRAQSLKWLTSMATVLVAVVSAFRSRKAPPDTKVSWIQSAMKGAQFAGTVWLALFARSTPSTPSSPRDQVEAER